MSNATTNHVWYAVLSCLCFAVLTPTVMADDLEKLDMPIVRDRDDFGLAITGYEATSQANFVKGESAKHTASLVGLLQAAPDQDVLCFKSRLSASSAKDDDRDERLVKGRDRRKEEYVPLLPFQDLRDRRNQPILLAPVELETIELERPAYEIEMLLVEGTAVVVEERESAEIPAIVADRFVDIGNNTEVRITAMQVNNKGVMKVTMDLRREGGDRGAVIDSMYALNEDGDVIGGGRWINQLDLFANRYEVELELALDKERGIDALRITLATEYEVVPVKFEIEKLFSK